jgi:hypothetical protein
MIPIEEFNRVIHETFDQYILPELQNSKGTLRQLVVMAIKQAYMDGAEAAFNIIADSLMDDHK